MPKARHNAYVGEAYGLLTVREVGLRCERSASQAARHQVGDRAVLCDCQCGGQRLVRVSALLRGRVTSCGCESQPRHSGMDVTSTDDPLVGSVEPADSPSAVPDPGRRSRTVGRQPTPIDVSAFKALMSEAQVAYSLDSRYLEAMLRSAVETQRKRKRWAIRIELRAAEKAARMACEGAGPRTCVVVEPCSTGSCPYAKGDHAELVGVPSLSKTSTNRSSRPQPRPAHVPGFTYSIEAAVQPLIDLRTGRGTLEPTGGGHEASGVMGERSSRIVGEDR